MLHHPNINIKSTASNSSYTSVVSHSRHPVIIWDGKTHVKGSFWANPNTSTFAPSSIEHNPKIRPLELKFDDNNIWIGFGFDWYNWKAGRHLGTNTTNQKYLAFKIKTKNLHDDLIVQLLCNGKVVDTPAHHTNQVKIVKYCPHYQDGKWHEVQIPLADLKHSKGYHSSAVTMIDFGFYSHGQSKGTILLNDIEFTSKLSTNPEDS